jgi:hypothetical protein
MESVRRTVLNGMLSHAVRCESIDPGNEVPGSTTSAAADGGGRLLSLPQGNSADFHNYDLIDAYLKEQRDNRRSASVSSAAAVTLPFFLLSPFRPFPT